ncbi:hypothetical protein CUJ86_06150 [Methanofollis fontis]|uniref:Uncharacterized protein n=2 Tax=Methanofollis fontis TaxID=2052832 RepID=A0A483CU82_9EURY|nr:hypothetical protein CUJ86_06150 [Methanofollis fontis]
MPDDYRVSVTAQKDPINRKITVTFNGGKGQENVLQMTAKVTRSDGTTEEKTITKPSGSTIRTGDTLEFAGTATQDRVEVWVTMDRALSPTGPSPDGERVFKVYDVLLPPK